MAFVSDTFTDTDGTNLGDHTGETGATWTSHPSYTTHAKIQSNRCYANGGSRCYYASGTPASADYDVEAVIRRVTTTANAGICGRLSTSANTMYVVLWEHNSGSPWWHLYKIVAGSPTGLGTYSDGPADGTDRTVKLEMRGTAIKVYVDGTERISVTDSAISDAGRAGLRTNAATSTTGYHIDSLTASDPSTTVARSAAIDAATALASAGAKLATTVSRSAALDASAAIAAVPTRIVTRVASLTAATQIATVGREQVARIASVTAATSVATVGQVIAEVVTGSAAITTTAAITTSGHIVKSRTAALSASTAVTTSGSLMRLRAAALTATAQIVTAGTEMGVTSRSAALTGTTQIATSSGLVRLRSASLTTSSQIATTGAPLAPTTRAATLTATTLIATDSGLVRLRSASLAATASIASTATATRYRPASLSATSAIASAWSPLARPAELVVSLSGDALVALDTSSLTTTLDTEATEVELQTA